VILTHYRRSPPARRGAPLSDPPPPKLDPKIGSPSLCEALPPVLPRRRLHPREADGVAARHCHRRPLACRGAPLSDPPPPKLDPKIGSPSPCPPSPPGPLVAGFRPAMSAPPLNSGQGPICNRPKRSRGPTAKVVFLWAFFSHFAKFKIANS